jgi:hypothetical protein
MRTYLIAYDLESSAESRRRLSTAIMQLGDAWARPLAQTWYVRTSQRRTALEGRLNALLDADDGLIIQEVATDAILMNTALRWFHQRRSDAVAAADDNVVAFPTAAQATALSAEAA